MDSSITSDSTNVETTAPEGAGQPHQTESKVEDIDLDRVSGGNAMGGWNRVKNEP